MPTFKINLNKGLMVGGSFKVRTSQDENIATATPTPTPTPTTETPTTPTVTPTNTVTPSITPSITSTVTLTVTPTNTVTPSAIPASPIIVFNNAFNILDQPLPQGNTAAEAYSISGEGTTVSPLSLVIGGITNSYNRVWMRINQTGTLNWTVTISSEGGYDYGTLYKHSGPVNTIKPPAAGFTRISNYMSGTNSESGTLLLLEGEFLVLVYTKDDSADAGSDTVTLSAYIQ